MRKNYIINIIIVLIALSPIAYLFLTWNAIPENFVYRFEFGKNEDRPETRQELMTATLVLSGVAAVLYLLLRNLHRFDPKVNRNTPRSAFHKLGFALVIFITTINYFLILSPQYDWSINASTVFAFLGGLFMVIGNYFNNIQPNYIAGIRLPWTLSDHDNWKKTHHLAARMWFGGGLLMIIVSLLVPDSILLATMITIMTLLILIPGIYSYRLYRSKLKNGTA